MFIIRTKYCLRGRFGDRTSYRYRKQRVLGKANQISCSRFAQSSLSTSSHVLMFSCLNKNLVLCSYVFKKTYSISSIWLTVYIFENTFLGLNQPFIFSTTSSSAGSHLTELSSPRVSHLAASCSSRVRLPLFTLQM